MIKKTIIPFLSVLPVLAQVPAIITSDPLPEADVGSSYSVQLEASNPALLPPGWAAGLPTTVSHWTVTAGSLTACGLSLNTGSGWISGTPVAGLCSITVTATDSLSTSSPVTLTLAAFSSPLLTHAGSYWYIGRCPNGLWGCDAKSQQPGLTDEQAKRLNGRVLDNLRWSCGDTITLAARARYAPYNQNTAWGLGVDRLDSLNLGPQTCSSGQTTRFVSSELSSLIWNGPDTWWPLSLAAKLAYLSHMAIIEGDWPPSQPTVSTYPYHNNYYFGGIAIVTPPVFFPGWNCGDMPNCFHGSAWGLGYSRDEAVPHGGQWAGSNVEIDRCYIGSAEGLQFGTINDWYHGTNNQGDNNTWPSFFRGSTAAMTLEGNSYLVHNSVLETGYDWTAQEPEFTLTSCTNSSPIQCTAPGIVSSLGINYTSYCYPNGTGNPPSLENSNCNAFGGVRFGVVTGARGGWGTTATDGSAIGSFNGMKTFIAKSDGAGGTDQNTVYVAEAWRSHAWAHDYPLDSSAWGPFTGTVKVKALPNASASGQFGISSGTGSVGVRVLNNYIDSPGWDLFLGGAGTPTPNQATVAAGSTWNSLNLTLQDGATPPAVGDWVFYYTWLHMIAYPGCNFVPTSACSQGYYRVGIVTAVAGTGPDITIALTGANAGFSATSDNAVPDPGGLVRWDGTTTANWQVQGNVFWTEPVITGKGGLEAKEGHHVLITGNKFLGTQTDPFATTHIQGGNPWANAAGFEFSYNVLMGDPSRNEGGQCHATMNMQDSEASMMPGNNAKWMHNVCPKAADGFSGMIYGGANIKVSHNTQTFVNGGFMIGNGNTICLLNPGSYETAPGLSYEGNLTYYGAGIGNYHGAGNCDNLPAGVNNNLLLGIGTMPSWVSSQGNAVAPSESAVGFVGTCDPLHWLGCALSPSSPYKGSLPDGSDPGADIAAVQDRLNRWSERAGILWWDPAQGALVGTPSAWAVSPATATLQFTSLDPDPGANCSFHIYTNLARTVEHPDTAGSGNSACNRPGNSVIGTGVTLVFGGHSPLAPGVTYTYSISNGSDAACMSDSSNNCARTMVGVFSTSGGAQPGWPKLVGTRITGGKVQ